MITKTGRSLETAQLRPAIYQNKKCPLNSGHLQISRANLFLPRHPKFLFKATQLCAEFIE